MRGKTHALHFFIPLFITYVSSFKLVIYLENTRVRWHFPKPSGRHLHELFVSVADELSEPSLTGETPSLLYVSISGVTFP